jgi:hypothetical protein
MYVIFYIHQNRHLCFITLINYHWLSEYHTLTHVWLYMRMQMRLPAISTSA